MSKLEMIGEFLAAFFIVIGFPVGMLLIAEAFGY